jgi:hypothetical protein
LSLPTFTEPDDNDIIVQYAEAFQKVYHYRYELLDYENKEKNAI